MLEVGRELIIRGAETLIALLGMTRYYVKVLRVFSWNHFLIYFQFYTFKIVLFFSVVSKVCHYVGSFFHYLLANSTENEEEKSVASVSAILFFILALQTGLMIFFLKKNYGLSFYIFWILLKIFKNNFFCEILVWLKKLMISILFIPKD